MAETFDRVHVSVMGSAASAFTMLHEGKVAVALAPYVALRPAEKGLGKNDVKRWLFEQGRMPAEELRRSWLWNTIARRDGWPRWVRAAVQGQGAVPAVRAPEDVTIVVAGGDLEIPSTPISLRGVSRLAGS